MLIHSVKILGIQDRNESAELKAQGLVESSQHHDYKISNEQV